MRLYFRLFLTLLSLAPHRCPAFLPSALKVAPCARSSPSALLLHCRAALSEPAERWRMDRAEIGALKGTLTLTLKDKYKQLTKKLYTYGHTMCTIMLNEIHGFIAHRFSAASVANE